MSPLASAGGHVLDSVHRICRVSIRSNIWTRMHARRTTLVPAGTQDGGGPVMNPPPIRNRSRAHGCVAAHPKSTAICLYPYSGWQRKYHFGETASARSWEFHAADGDL